MTLGGTSHRSGGCSRSQSPEHRLVPRLSLPNAPQSSPRDTMPWSPRNKTGPGSPNHPSSRARHTPEHQKGSPRFGTPQNSARDSVRDSARDSARLESARRRHSESVKEHVRRRNCTSTGQRSSVGKEKRPNPLLNNKDSKGTPSSVRRSPRVASPEDEGGTGSTNCSVNGLTISTPGTPAGRGAHTRRSSQNQTHELPDVVRAIIRSPMDGDGLDVDEIDGNMPACPPVEIPVVQGTAVVRSSDQRASVDPTTASAFVVTRMESCSSSASTARPEDFMANTSLVTAYPVGSEGDHNDYHGFRFGGHKKTPSFRCLPDSMDGATIPLDNGALPSARTMSSPVPQSVEEHPDVYDGFQEEDTLTASTGARIEDLCEKAQRLVQEMGACVPSVAAPPRSMGPGRPPRPPCSTMGSLSGSPGHVECEGELNSLKFRVSNLELNLNSARGDPRGASEVCSGEVEFLRRQLAETQGQLFDAKEEIQQARGQMYALEQRLNIVLPYCGANSISSDASRSVSAPMHLLTPRPTPSPPVVAVGTPALSSHREVQPGVAVDVALSSRSYSNIEFQGSMQITPATPSGGSATTASPMPKMPIHRQTSFPQECSTHPAAQFATATVPASATASPMPSARIQRRPSSPQPQLQACHTSSHLSLTPSSGSFVPHPRILVATPCESARASPFRGQAVQSHAQSAPCISSTPPPSARLVGSQMSFSHALVKEDLLTRGTALSTIQYQAAVPGRNTPIRSKLAPSHVARTPRIAG